MSTVDEIAELMRRNIQKTIALDALILDLRRELVSAPFAPACLQNSGNDTDAASASSMTRLAIGAQAGHGERHGDAMVAEGIDLGARGTSGGRG